MSIGISVERNSLCVSNIDSSTCRQKGARAVGNLLQLSSLPATCKTGYVYPFASRFLLLLSWGKVLTLYDLVF